MYPGPGVHIKSGSTILNTGHGFKEKTPFVHTFCLQLVMVKWLALQQGQTFHRSQATDKYLKQTNRKKGTKQRESVQYRKKTILEYRKI